MLSVQAVDLIMPGQVIARVRSGVSEEAVAAGHGAVVSARGYRNAFVVLQGAAGNEAALAARLRADPRVAYTEPNYLRQPSGVRPELWAFYNPGGLAVTYTRGRLRLQPATAYLSTADADADAAPIWENTAGTWTLLASSIDTGVDLTHPEFASGQLLEGWDWYDDDDDPSDEGQHGTHTAGTMVGETVGIAGVTGAGENVKLYVQRACGRRGCPVSAIANAIRAAADQTGMVAINLSLGGRMRSQTESEAIEYAVDTKDVLVIASAGNTGRGTLGCPACDERTIAVAATNWQDELAYYSSYGPGLDLTAPGGELFRNTTAESGIFSAMAGGGYAYRQGTSMATPHVTGTAVVVAGATGLRGAALRSRLLSSTDDLGDAGYDETFGQGRLNTYRAIMGSTLGGGG